jgi:drug/metabolite transporter (DMT)-like permease
MLMVSVGAFRRNLHAFNEPVLRNRWAWLIFIGMMLSFHFSAWFVSLSMTSVAASVVLTDSSPIFTAVLSALILRESPRRRAWAGVLIAFMGACVLALGDVEYGGTEAFAGDLLALLSAFFLAVYFTGGRRYARGIPNSVYTTVVYFSAALTTLVLCVMSGADVIVLIPSEVALFVALAVFPTALGHSVNNYLLTLVPAYVVSSAVLGEPIGAALLAALILKETPSTITLVGFMVILLGVALVLMGLPRNETKTRSALDDSDGP